MDGSGLRWSEFSGVVATKKYGQIDKTQVSSSSKIPVCSSIFSGTKPWLDVQRLVRRIVDSVLRKVQIVVIGVRMMTRFGTSLCWPRVNRLIMNLSLLSTWRESRGSAERSCFIMSSCVTICLCERLIFCRTWLKTQSREWMQNNSDNSVDKISELYTLSQEPLQNWQCFFQTTRMKLQTIEHGVKNWSV